MKEVKIGSQIWAQEDLRVMRFRNGDEIPVVQDREEWANMRSSAMCINPDTGVYLYNWYAVNDERGLAPKGWHIPSDAEWTVLTDYLGGLSVAGYKMKSSYAERPAWNGSNSSGFSGLPGGYRNYGGYFVYVGTGGFWWSSSPYLSDAWTRKLNFYNDDVNRYYDSKQVGMSVRCIKNNVVCKQPKEDLRAKFIEHSVRVDSLTKKMNKKFAELTSEMNAIAEEMDRLQSSIDCLWKSRKS